MRTDGIRHPTLISYRLIFNRSSGVMWSSPEFVRTAVNAMMLVTQVLGYNVRFGYFDARCQYSEFYLTIPT
jgi:hypothetical protein